jgi:hypothetical protein
MNVSTKILTTTDMKITNSLQNLDPHYSLIGTLTPFMKLKIIGVLYGKGL